MTLAIIAFGALGRLTLPCYYFYCEEKLNKAPQLIIWVSCQGILLRVYENVPTASLNLQVY